MGYGDMTLMEAREETIREAIRTWKGIRETARQQKDANTVKVANRMLDKYEGELQRRAGA